MSDHGTVRWHRALRADQPNTVHLAIEGQTARVSEAYTGRWVWSVDGWPVGAQHVEKVAPQDRCPACLKWLKLHGAPPNDEKPPAPST